MNNRNTDEDTIRQLEQRLLQPDVRRSAKDVSELLADDFIEYGSSGRVFDKKQVVEGLQGEDPAQLAMSDFEAKTLAPGVVLATYRATRHNPDGQTSQSLRSSIWKLIDGRWQITFHQGTPTRTV
ncbi:MAG: DUF4440 domain-containing protein [Chloroflexi bacterium]|jgi:hypothetical protein|nr:DUF4440 domain-containing protein [Chloroflexota bacterium]MBT7079891.1 DUF4440 domain-containing protein [Chloroflexota bacterium]MBT7290126.1 DUF4440 domain-containing protein [Chloroflexota bacterium]